MIIYGSVFRNKLFLFTFIAYIIIYYLCFSIESIVINLLSNVNVLSTYLKCFGVAWRSSGALRLYLA